MTQALCDPPTSEAASEPTPRRLPLAPLLALALGGFVTILTEALPAGLLPQMSAGLGVSEALVGQLVTAYALGSLLAAIPLTLATQGVNRRPLLLAAIAGFALANTVTALSSSFALTLVARFLAGIAAGLLWALVAGYAARMAAPEQKGRAIAVAMVGTPLALSIGIPAGTFLGQFMGWRAVFGLMTLLSIGLVAWVRLGVPDFAGQAAGRRARPSAVVALPGIRPVLLVVLGFVLAHNVLYTFIAPVLAPFGMQGEVGLALLVFGVAALGGIWLTGVLIDRALRALVLASTLAFAVSVLPFAFPGTPPLVIHAALALWGLAFGGAATLFQTALAQAAGEAADVAQSMLVTAWNLAIAGGGLLGGLLLSGFGPAAFPPVLLALLGLTFLVALRARRHGFPPRSGDLA